MMSKEDKNIGNGEYVVKDSGEREEFSTGAKRDTRAGKGRYDLISSEFLDRLAKVAEAGSIKYGDWNFAKGMPSSRCLDSCLRHINKYRMGYRDEDHLVQAAWNLMALIEIQFLISQNRLSEDLDDVNRYDEIKS